MKQALLFGFAAALAVFVWQAGIPWWSSQHQPGLAVGSVAMVAVPADEFAFVAQSPDDMGHALDKIGHGTHLNSIDGLVLMFVMLPIANGEQVRVLELGRTGNVMLARVEPISSPSFVARAFTTGWVASAWLTPVSR